MSTAISNVRSRQEWAEIINADWRKSIDNIIQTGRDLIAAKGELPRGDFHRMIEADLSFSGRTANHLMKIADHPMINSTAASKLPPSWAVLSELSRLSANDFADAQSRGLIAPTTSSRAARAVATAYNNSDERPVGQGQSVSKLPTPIEARDIARETGRMVAASDGHIYTGATVEEEAQYTSRRREVFSIREAIERIADSDQSAGAWLADTEPHWLHDFRLSAIDDAIEWLGNLKEAMGVVDA